MTAAVIELPRDLDAEGAAEPAPHYEFDELFQRKIAALLIRDTQFAQLTEGLIEPQFFENTAMAGLVSVAQRYIAHYRKAPGDKTVLASLMKDAIRDKTLPIDVARQAVAAIPELYETDVSDREYVADQCAEFARHQAMTRAILDSVDLIERRDFDAIASKVRAAMDTGVSVTGGSYNYADMLKVRTEARKERASGVAPKTGITTGYPAIDDYLYHKGWGRREMSLLMGAAKAGKSMALITFGINAVAHGYKVLYATLEVSKDVIAERMDANIAEVVMMEMDTKIHEVEAKVSKFLERAAPFIIEEFPSGDLSPSALRRVIEHYKARGMIFDLVIVDYADLMRPDRVTDSAVENSKSVYVNLRGMAMKEGFALLTATQTNRGGAEKAVATMTDVAEDFNRIRIADVVISINKTDEERAMNEARLFWAASRNQRSGFTVRIEQDQDRAKFIKRVIGEEP